MALNKNVILPLFTKLPFKTTSCVILFLFTCKMTDQLLRFTFLLALIQGPITLALHPSTENNHILVGYAFKQFFSRDWLNCIQVCHDESRCISYNYERSAGADGLCELNHCGVEELSYRDRLLIYSSGFVYQQIRRRKVGFLS